MQKQSISYILVLSLLSMYSLVGQAIGITDKSAFLNNLAGSIGVLDFDNLAHNTPISGTVQTVSGNTGIIFPASVTDWQNFSHQLQVVTNINDNNPTTSNQNSLGTDDTDNYNTIIGGTVINLGFTNPIIALGLSFITPDLLFDDDIRLVTGGDAASLMINDKTFIGSFDGIDYYAYFLGLIGNINFSSASIQYGPDVIGGPFLFNIDDIIIATVSMPEPGTAGLMLGGIFVIFMRALRNKIILN
ncbi:MAG: hypothetical protein E6Q61_07940 [Nitrosomonas sp.]|nr:MAG: hypothetical protein E6Q61_07940 [Nitrosomonas sp.]